MIRVITCCRNTSRWIDKTCASVIMQTHQDWKMYVVDDCSDDDTLEKVPSDDRIVKICQPSRMGKLHNLVHVLRSESIGAEDIIVIVDGDDWLSGIDVFERVLRCYYMDALLVWTMCQDFPSKTPWHVSYGLKPRSNTPPRNWTWYPCHLGTFRRKLFDHVSDDDLRDASGKYFAAATDCALFIPMLEMTWPKYAVHYQEICYVYNRTNSMSHGAVACADGKVERLRDLSLGKLQSKCLGEIRMKKPYKVLP